ncbi:MULTISPECIES: hypothetical protein [unclassified Streptomyces]|nr:hypothetical protein [Streptomyces sp. NBC_01750]WSB05068.1 hypothetical protein OIE54_41240 [Streptomyces sp. NBC_01794]WSD30646.1 hypothetical protein OG966_00800 [Streptomyces sp. NBC_01750]
MRQKWAPEDVVACWTVVDGDWDLVASMRASLGVSQRVAVGHY